MNFFKSWGVACGFCNNTWTFTWRLLVTAYLLFGLYGLILAFNAIDDDDPPIIFNKQSRVEPDSVKRGEYFDVILNIRKTRNCDGYIYQSLSGKCGLHLLMQGKSIIPYGYDGELKTRFKVPESTNTGECFFNTGIDYVCNVFDKIRPLEVIDNPIPLIITE